MKELKSHKTAGGVVLNHAGHMLVIVRDVVREGRVVHEIRLPKGHIDPGETPEAAACREVCEESGYCCLKLVADLGAAVSEYVHRGRQHHREERYFLMQLTREERQAPAPAGHEEALFQPEWLTPEAAEQQLTYASEREFVRRARTLLQT